MFSKIWSVLLVVYLFSNFSHGQRDKKFFREDYTYLETTEGFYKIHTIPQNWTEAKRVCALEGASLFHPNNRDEANAVISFWKSIPSNIVEVYVGLSDITSEGQFETVDGKSVSEVYNQWRQGEPNDSNGNEDCVFLYLNGELNDYLCDVKSNFICKKSLLTLEPNYNCNLINSDGQRDKKFFREDYTYLETTEGFYKIHTIPQTWAEAKRVCALEGASLFHPDNRYEANAVISFWNSTKPKIQEVYIGLSDITSEGKFETVDGKLVSEVYNQWMHGEPNDSNGKEDCVFLYLNGELNDYRCDVKSNFICKKSLLTLGRNYNCNLIKSDGQRDKKFFREDYTYLETTEGFYKIHTIPQNWTEAKRVCALEGASLFHPDNRYEANAVISFWNSTKPKIQEVYIGLSDIKSEGKFETVDGKSVSEVYNQWMHGEPSNSNGNEDCVFLYLNGELNDYRCDVKSNFICKKRLLPLERNYNCNLINSDGQRDKKFFCENYTYLETTGGFYKIHTIPQTWAEAKRVCALEGASLFHPDNRYEANAVISFWNSTKPEIQEVFIGLSDITSEGKFETVDGKSASEVYNQWMHGEPSDSNGNEDCVFLYLNGELNDYRCDVKSNFICKKSLLPLERNYNCNLINSDGQRDKKFFRENYTYLETTGGFYKIHTIPQTWAEANRMCALEGASLFHPDNRYEANAVISFWNSTNPKIQEVYIGLSDITSEGKFETVDGKSVSEVYNQWMHGEPSDSNGNEDCVFLYLNGELNDYRCDVKSNFICKKSLLPLERNYNCNMINSDGQRDKKFFREDFSFLETTEGFYKNHTIPQTCAEAKKECALEGASLFHPDNRDKANAAISFWNSTKPKILELYIGSSEGKFETVDGKSDSEVYNPWKHGEPSDSNGNEDCVFLYLNGELNDYRSDLKSNFICKKSLLTLERNYNCNLINSGKSVSEVYNQWKQGDSVSNQWKQGEPSDSNDGQKKDKKFFRKDYTYIETSQGFYKIHTTPQNWTDAKRVCALEGASLFYPDNDHEAHAVLSFWNSTQPTYIRVFVGMSELMVKGQFETIDGKLVSEVYNNWMPGEPNHSGGIENCVNLYKEGYINDCPCNIKDPFICKKSLQSLEWNYQCNMPNLDYTFNNDTGKCYKLHLTPLNWTEAYNMCRVEECSLAVINNQLEANYLANFTEYTSKPRVKWNYQRGIYHVGFHNRFKEGWQTVKGTPMNVDADSWWDNYQPEGDDHEECGSMFYTGRLINIDCDTRSFFICEHEVDS